MKKLYKISGFILALIVILLSGFFYGLYQINTPLNETVEAKTFIIESGDSVFEIGQQLKDQNLIRSKFWFSAYVFAKGWGAKLQAGEYNLNSSTDIVQISKKITGGHIIEEENDVQVTIPEGFRLSQIDARLAANNLIEEGQLINYSAGKKLEGYLFPDTYRFDPNSTIEDIVEKMKANFETKVNNSLKAEIAKQGKSIDEIVILASIVQAEGFSNKEMPTIASVFYNRLIINYPLQSDATVNFVTRNERRRPTIKDTQVQSPYNTYLNSGLTPGPISSPGLEAIKATIFPTQTDYFYFLHPLDSPAIFSKTLDEHNQNAAKYLQ